MPEISDPGALQRIQTVSRPSAGVIRGPAPTIDPAQAANIGIASRRLALDEEEAARERDKPQLSPAEEAVDKGFAEEFVNWTIKGGFSDFQKQTAQLEDAIGTLESSDSVTGPLVGRLPDSVNQFFGNDEAIATREAVEEVVQRNLRLILGAQFTEEEGKRLIARAYNPRLEEKENVKRVKRLLGQMQAAAKVKEDAARFYRENGTLKGWGGSLPSITDFDPSKETKPEASSDDEALIRKYLD